MFAARRMAFSTSLMFLFAASASAQTSFPMITSAHPVAVQRGKTAEVVVIGQQSFLGVYKTLFDRTGLSAEVIPQKTPVAEASKKTTINNVKLKITAADDAPLGEREFRVASTLGVSSIGQLVIVDDPVIVENAANNTLAQAQTISLPCVVAGKLEALEDVDFFKFEAQAGQTLTFEVFCARLQDKIHDLQKHAKPMLTLFDAEGRELAANDTFFFADPMLSFTIAKTGAYFLQIRESTYDGDQRWVYALLATTKPYVSHLFPMAGNPGQKIDVEPIGSAAKIKQRVPLTVPNEIGVRQVQLDLDGTKSNLATILVNNLPPFIEQEPNDESKQATRITLPAGINGRIGKKRDLDHFVFKAEKGKGIRFELKARRFGTLLNSSVHGVLEILNQKAAVVAANDTTHGPEANLVFTPPDSADFVLRVRDLNSKGGDSFVYHVEADWARPDFTLRCDPDKAMIGPGSATAWYAHVSRSNGFTGPVLVEVKGLPTDVTASPLTIPPSMTQGVIVVTAAPTAQQQAVNVQVVGSAKVKSADGKEEMLIRKAQPNQEIYFPGGGRGRFDVNLQTVAITDPSDILKVDVNTSPTRERRTASTTKIVLKPGQEVKIDVNLVRRPDYDKTVSLDILMQHLGSIIGNPLPPGVTIEQGKSKTLLGTGSQGHFTLKAAANAEPIEDVPICVLAHVSINFVVKMSYASPVILVSVKKD
ncbi:MAG: PPC domain-containing protein [Gemmataceae bacterium]|nr:PPC domain-containing protein [Gemmataceae bacterium]MCI0739760.1 PPC domain-containing protein [Gemmataceae bacterium]